MRVSGRAAAVGGESSVRDVKDDQEANRVPNNEAGLVRSALPARGAKIWGSHSAPPGRGRLGARFGVRAHSLSAADIRAAGRVVIGAMTGKVGAKPS